ncbi:MAG TPA: hypothetical protein VMZ30_02720 [Pyrinomonadaceae bacterium]|nr:hypothetical protein [Pyrinomonadaceae bacterium]
MNRGSHISRACAKPSELYPWEDYEWYATDTVGHVAVFTTAGIGPIPVSVLSARSLEDALAVAVGKMLPRGRATMLVSLPTPDDYIHFAACGFFAYDWQDVHRTKFKKNRYEMLSEPGKPIHVSELPEQFQSLLRSTTFANLSFANTRKIDVVGCFKCESAAPDVEI